MADSYDDHSGDVGAVEVGVDGSVRSLLWQSGWFQLRQLCSRDRRDCRAVAHRKIKSKRNLYFHCMLRQVALLFKMNSPPCPVRYPPPQLARDAHQHHRCFPHGYVPGAA
ncbi:hypothetical protein KCP76_24430 [Salmonella enterica subsp. enterica serovar Weltevreden]|nr:hypothetical protein KCP76_24430 [Salmonella enterica subsp. enterica serovar Weltevreden]